MWWSYYVREIWTNLHTKKGNSKHAKNLSSFFNSKFLRLCPFSHRFEFLTPVRQLAADSGTEGVLFLEPLVLLRPQMCTMGPRGHNLCYTALMSRLSGPGMCVGRHSRRKTLQPGILPMLPLSLPFFFLIGCWEKLSVSKAFSSGSGFDRIFHL